MNYRQKQGVPALASALLYRSGETEMEDLAMKRNAMPLFLLALALVLAFGLLLTGCGLNQAQGEPVIDADAPDSQEQVLDDRAAELDAERAALAQEKAEIAEREALLAARQARAEAEAEAAARQPIVLTVPSLTNLEIDLNDDLSSETSVVGDAVTAIVVQDVIVDDLVAIAAGSEIQGVVTQAVPTRSFGGMAQLRLSFDRLITVSGEDLPIVAVLELSGQRQKKKDAATIGGSSAGGALLGRILNDKNRDKGTAVGAVVGAAIGAIVAANNKVDAVDLPAGTPLVLTLDAPLTIELDRDV
jgi:hypothetical protein